MPEQTLNLALSGEEIRIAILDKIGQSLQRDCFLSPNHGYDYYTAKVKIELTCHDVGRQVDVAVKETVTGGEPSEDMHLEASEAEFAVDAQPPNEVRVESGQGVPVLGKDTEGRQEVKKVHYARGKAKKAV